MSVLNALHLIIYVYLYAFLLATFICTTRRWSNLCKNKFHGEQRFLLEGGGNKWRRAASDLFFTLCHPLNEKTWVGKIDLKFWNFVTTLWNLCSFPSYVYAFMFLEPSLRSSLFFCTALHMVVGTWPFVCILWAYVSLCNNATPCLFCICASEFLRFWNLGFFFHFSLFLCIFTFTSIKGWNAWST